jgi:hypothetical protein
MNSKTSPMKKTGAIITASIIALASIAVLLAGTQLGVQSALGQAQKSSNAITINEKALSIALNNFTATGRIGGSIPATATSGNTSSSAGSSSSYILAGDWSMSVMKGNVTNFKAGFAMVKPDGSDYHIHNVTGFKVGNNTTFKLNPMGMATINGTTDVSVNGTLKWPGAHGTVSIDKLLIMSLKLNSSDTSNHFSGQPIYGVVSTLTSQNGTQIVSPGAAVSQGGGSQSGGGGGIQGFVSNATNAIGKLFGGK